MQVNLFIEERAVLGVDVVDARGKLFEHAQIVYPETGHVRRIIAQAESRRGNSLEHRAPHLGRAANRRVSRRGAGPWLDGYLDADRAEFERRADVVAEQYQAYTVLDGLALNGRLTLGENIADLGGLRIAYAALQEALKATGRQDVGGLTAEQRFFISFARVWRQSTVIWK